MRKVFVDVTARIDQAGQVRPLIIHWEDGRSYAVDRVLDVRRAASTKVGGSGMRYTLRIGQKETYLFEEGMRWYVEAR